MNKTIIMLDLDIFLKPVELKKKYPDLLLSLFL